MISVYLLLDCIRPAVQDLIGLEWIEDSLFLLRMLFLFGEF